MDVEDQCKPLPRRVLLANRLKSKSSLIISKGVLPNMSKGIADILRTLVDPLVQEAITVVIKEVIKEVTVGVSEEELSKVRGRVGIDR